MEDLVLERRKIWKAMKWDGLGGKIGDDLSRNAFYGCDGSKVTCAIVYTCFYGV